MFVAEFRQKRHSGADVVGLARNSDRLIAASVECVLVLIVLADGFLFA